MSARLGEMLLKVGALNEEQLEQVLNAQAMYGGRLGTNLVEMGLIAEDELARALNEKLGVPCVDLAALNSIPQEVLRTIPVDLVQRYQVLPVGVEGKKLTVAMADPCDFNAIDEIGFVSGYVVVPRVCSELRLTMALERYFGIKRAVRYIPVNGGSRSRFGSLDLPQGEMSHAVQPPVDLRPRRVTVEELAEKLSGSSSESDVLTVLMSYLQGEFDWGAFFSVKQESVVGVRAVSAGTVLGGFAGCSISIENGKLLQRVVREKLLFVGELPGAGAERQIVEAMGGPATSPLAMVPISVSGQVAALLCASDDKGRLSGGVFELQRVAAMAELTFEMICIRKRIKST